MKKYINNFRILSVLALVILSLSSCLKDPRFINYAGSPPLVEFPLAAYNANVSVVLGAKSPYVISVAAQAAAPNNGTFTFPLLVNIASANVLSTAVTYTVATDQAVFTGAPSAVAAKSVTSNAEATPIATLTPLPAADFSITGLTGTIPAGQRTAQLNVTLNTTLIGSGVKNYGLRLVITSASQQVSNYNYITYIIQLSN